MKRSSILKSKREFKDSENVYDSIIDIPLIKITRLNSIAQKRHSLNSELGNQIIDFSRLEDSQNDRRK